MSQLKCRKVNFDVDASIESELVAEGKRHVIVSLVMNVQNEVRSTILRFCRRESLLSKSRGWYAKYRVLSNCLFKVDCNASVGHEKFWLQSPSLLSNRGEKLNMNTFVRSPSGCFCASSIIGGEIVSFSYSLMHMRTCSICEETHCSHSRPI